MSEENSGVNGNGGDFAPAESSPIQQTQDQTVESTNTQSVEGNSSAETLNTSTQPSAHVPYERFKEIYEQNKALKEASQSLAALEYLASQNPEFVEEFKATVQKYTQPKAQPNNSRNQEASIPPEFESFINEFSELKTEITIEKYVNDFDQMAKDLPKEIAAAFQETTAIKLREMRGLEKYNQNLLKKAFNETMKIYEPAINALKPKPQPQAANVPSSVRTMAPSQNVGVMDRATAAAFIANGLRQQ